MYGYRYSANRFEVGDMHNRVDIQTLSTARDSFNQAIQTFTTAVSSWPCKIEYANGTEGLRGRQVTEQVSAVFTGHFIDGIDITMRIKHGTTYYGIVRVVPLRNASRNFLELHAKVEA